VAAGAADFLDVRFIAALKASGLFTPPETSRSKHLVHRLPLPPQVPSEPQAEPMSHFEYLLALLPQASRDLLPAPYGELMRGPRGPLAEMSAAPFASGTEYAAVPGAR